MTGHDIRQKFLEFFKSKDHVIVPSDSLVPKDDPTVLFTTAGMQQFKRQFLGLGGEYRRAASCQKCLRTDDLEKIGTTPYHHTFFEMLGNFSFGDYFKKKAIEYAWEFLTQEMKLPKEKLWVSVYKEDDEAFDVWLNIIKIPREKILKLGDKDNFWPSEAREKGPNGPCGPCSEIFYDYGVNSKCPKGNACDPSCDCGRFTEIWNLVFTQFNRKEGGGLEPLPKKNIDTGMGLERLVAVVQGVKSNFETDLFEPILKALHAETRRILLSSTEKNIIADHMRAIVFTIGDGVIPSNKERGSVVKKLIVESTDLILQKSETGRFVLHKLIPAVVNTMHEVYPELIKNEDNITHIVKKTEEAFGELLNEKIPELEKKIGEIKALDRNRDEKILEYGKLVFKYRDTHGLTLESIRNAFKAKGIKSDDENAAFKKFEHLMREQQTRSRTASKMKGEVFTSADLKLDAAKSKFIGYEHTAGEGRILKLFIGEREVEEARAGDQVKIVLDKTPFYAEAGGQIGDTGTLSSKHGRIRILDTKKQDDIYIHFGKVEEGELKIGESVDARIDSERRLSIMRNHTATHLLQSVLREILGTHVQQQGSLVAEDRLRFDFTHPKAVTKDQLAQIEDEINKRILHNDKVIKEEMSLEQAKTKGALAFFAEKYGNRVRVVSIGNYSKEFCGGTHLDSTGEIKRFIISSEGAVAQGIRRLEARTGSGADEFVKERAKKEIERKELDEKRRQELKKKKEADRQRWESFKNNLATIIEKAESVNNTKIIACTFADSDPAQLRKFSDVIKQRVRSVTVCLGTASHDSASVIVGVSGDLIQRGINANELIQAIAPLINGSGGGRPEIAEAGSKKPGKLKSAMQQVVPIIKNKLKP